MLFSALIQQFFAGVLLMLCETLLQMMGIWGISGMYWRSKHCECKIERALFIFILCSSLSNPKLVASRMYAAESLAEAEAADCPSELADPSSVTCRESVVVPSPRQLRLRCFPSSPSPLYLTS
jgi:hypothetical protein